MKRVCLAPLITSVFFAGAQLSAQVPITDLAAQPASISAGIGVSAVISCLVTDANVLADSVLLQRLDGSGNVVGTLGPLRDNGQQGDATAGDSRYAATFSIYEANPGILRLRASAAVRGSARRVLSPVLEVPITGVSTGIRILSPARDAYVSLSPVVVRGQISDPSVAVTVNGITAVKSGLEFTASVPLIEGTNTLTAVSVATGGASSSDSLQVVLDTTPPRVTISSPAEGFRTTDLNVTVSGIVNDIVVGTVNPLQATVTVNGVAAQVSNRTFSRTGVPLQLGSNTIRAEGRDRAGNTFSQSIVVVREAAAPNTATLRLLSGNNQTAPINSVAPAPLSVQVTNAAGQPAANVPVTFRVIENNGLVNNLPAAVATTNSQGRAQVQFRLGSRAGAGSNRIEAIAAGYQGTANFSATGTNGAAAKIVVDSGLNQTGATGRALPFPFVAVVTDAGNNRLPNVPVTFAVRGGGGNINGSTSFSTTSDSDGRVMATLTLGLEEGRSNNLVEANFAGNTGQPAIFSATAFTPGPVQDTSISGVVQDNSNQPIANVTIRLFQIAQGAANGQPVQIGTPVTTDARGFFRINNAPVGTMKLMADGSTALPNGAWPTLEFDLVTVAGRENGVGMPIYLPRLDQVNRLCVSETTGGTLTLPNAPGFSLTVAPGSATFPGGSRSGCISVTPVNPDKVPMVPGFGQQPRFVVTIQPVGTVFNGPARITIPNVDGLAPREKTEMYSYDHDLAAFVAIGTGTVSEDGATISSDPGVGVIKAGWHCGGNPNPTGSAGTCPTCQRCQNGSCVPTAGSCNDNNVCTQNDACRNGQCVGEPVDNSTWRDATGVQIDSRINIPPGIVTKLNSIFSVIPGLSGTRFKEARVGATGRVRNCCHPQNGPQTDGLFEGAGTFQLTAEVTKVPLWGTPSISREFDFGIAIISVDFQIGIQFNTNLRLNVQAGYRTDRCNNEDCGFGEVNVSLDPELKATAEAIACLETLWTTRACGGLTISPAALRMNIQGYVSFNKPACNSGLGGGVRIGSLQFRAEFSLDVPAAPRRLVFTYDLISSPIQL